MLQPSTLPETRAAGIPPASAVPSMPAVPRPTATAAASNQAGAALSAAVTAAHPPSVQGGFPGTSTQGLAPDVVATDDLASGPHQQGLLSRSISALRPWLGFEQQPTSDALSRSADALHTSNMAAGHRRSNTAGLTANSSLPPCRQPSALSDTRSDSPSLPEHRPKALGEHEGQSAAAQGHSLHAQATSPDADIEPNFGVPEHDAHAPDGLARPGSPTQLHCNLQPGSSLHAGMASSLPAASSTACRTKDPQCLPTTSSPMLPAMADRQPWWQQPRPLATGVANAWAPEASASDFASQSAAVQSSLNGTVPAATGPMGGSMATSSHLANGTAIPAALGGHKRPRAPELHASNPAAGSQHEVPGGANGHDAPVSSKRAPGSRKPIGAPGHKRLLPTDILDGPGRKRGQRVNSHHASLDRCGILRGPLPCLKGGGGFYKDA